MDAEMFTSYDQNLHGKKSIVDFFRPKGYSLFNDFTGSLDAALND